MRHDHQVLIGKSLSLELALGPTPARRRRKLQTRALVFIKVKETPA